MELLSADDYVSMPWANGRGSTLEITRFPAADQWHWRLSLATVAEDGPFSPLPGVHRALVVATGAGMNLSVDGSETHVPEHGVIHFDGGATTVCALIDGPVSDLNLMVRAQPDRGFAGVSAMFSVEQVERGAPVVFGADTEQPHQHVAVTVLRGSITATTNAGTVPSMVLAHARDTVLLNGHTTTTLSSPRGAVIAVATVRTVRRPHDL